MKVYRNEQVMDIKEIHCNCKLDYTPGFIG
jgi:hypothetical protein